MVNAAFSISRSLSPSPSPSALGLPGSSLGRRPRLVLLPRFGEPVWEGPLDAAVDGAAGFVTKPICVSKRRARTRNLPARRSSSDAVLAFSRRDTSARSVTHGAWILDCSLLSDVSSCVKDERTVDKFEDNAVDCDR